MTIPSIDFGGNGEELVFLHANGYPPECYRPLLTRLAEKLSRHRDGAAPALAG